MATATCTTNPWQFADEFYDRTTGLYKFGVRYYDPTLGRWTQQDPLGGSLFDPSTGNRYAYTNDDPTNLTDPTGTFTINPVGACGFVATLSLVGLGVATVVSGGGLIALDALTVPMIVFASVDGGHPHIK